MVALTAYDTLVQSNLYSENPEIDAHPVEAFISRWQKYRYFIEPVQHRMYEAVAHKVIGQRVCDIGSGSGVGTVILAQQAVHVVGLEKNIDAVKFSQACYPLRNVEFICGDIAQAQFSTPFTTAVAIELIEHIADYHGAFKAIIALLEPSGVLYISSPNRNKSTLGQSKPRNPHHVREWTINEFREILGLYFTEIAFFEPHLETSLSSDSNCSPIVAICSGVLHNV